LKNLKVTILLYISIGENKELKTKSELGVGVARVGRVGGVDEGEGGDRLMIE